jgi:hypothetical protein
MGFASSWLESGTLFPVLINEATGSETGIIIVVPAYDEPFITEMLDSLALCRKPVCGTEVIIILNASAKASEESLRNNNRSYNEIEAWKKRNESFFRVFVVNLGKPEIKGWGVGLARKTGMDEAAKRFDSINRPEGVIANLDADCLVQENYLVSLENELLKRKERKACSIYFEHPVSGDRYPAAVYQSVYQYELHLRYYIQALAFAGFPNIFHTVGSSIAVKSLSYIKAGGMNRRQAGEDFYFVQKLIPAGGYFSLNSTTVFPSPRTSERVPFGTGAAVGKMVLNNEKVLLTYNPQAFRDLSLFVGATGKFYTCNQEEMRDIFQYFPGSLKSFLGIEEWISGISEVKNNTSGLSSFSKRFFEWFNMFKIVKYLNFSHKSIFEKVPVNDAAEELLIYKNIDPLIGRAAGLLEFYRKMEKLH